MLYGYQTWSEESLMQGWWPSWRSEVKCGKLCSMATTLSRQLRSSCSDGTTLVEPRTRCVTFGDRAFSAYAPRLWNRLSGHIKDSTFKQFKKHLKSHLFKKCLPAVELSLSAVEHFLCIWRYDINLLDWLIDWRMKINFMKVMNHHKKWPIKGPYADHILIPQGSTGSSILFDIKWKPIFFWL